MTSIIVVSILLILYVWYMTIIKRKNQYMEALSGIDVQLTKRHDLIPNILNIAKKFMEHEKNLIKEVTALRTKIPYNYHHDDINEVSEYFKASNDVASKMADLLIQVENYPDLKSNEAMLQAQLTYNEVEGHISAARRFYNAATTELNNSIQIFPGNIIAKLINVEAMPFYQADKSHKQMVDANKIL